TRANNAVAAVKEGLLPITQRACLIMPFVRYHDFEGAALDLDERERIVGDLGDDGRAVILRNHGALTVGRSVGEAWVWNYRLESACRYQVDAMSLVAGGLTTNWLDEATVRKTAEQGVKLLSSDGAVAVGQLE